MSDLLGRFRYLLCYLLLSSLCVVSITSPRTPTDLGIGAQLVIRVTLPLQRMVTLPIEGVRNLWRDYVALVDVRRENLRLRETLALLREENLQYREAIVASERFSRLKGFRERHDVPMVPANVIAQDLSPWFRSIVIGQGSGAGIRTGMPVITDEGLVGVVVGTTPRAAKVLLTIDLQSRVDAYVQRTRARGTLRGTSRQTCEFEYVLRDDDVREGDVLLTSGLGDLFPKGLVVGRVTRVERQPYGLFQRAEVKTAVDLQRLEEVFVLLEQRELPEEEAFSAPDAEPGLWQEAGG